MFREKFIHLILKRPVYFLIVSVLVSVCTAPFLFKLRLDFTNNAWFAADSAILQRINDFEKEFQNDETLVLALESQSSLIDKKNLELIFELTEKITEFEEIYSSESLANFKWIHSRGDEIIIEPLFERERLDSIDYLTERKKIIAKDEQLQKYLITKNHKLSFIIGRLRNYGTDQPNYSLLYDKVQKLIEKYKRTHPEIQFHLLGRVSVNAALKQVSFKDTETLVPALGILIIIFLIIYFRNLASVLLPTLVIVMSTLTTMGVAGYFGMKMVSISFIIPIILMAIGIADSIHIINTFRRKLSDLPKIEALKYSMEHNFSPTFLTSVTTSIGFLSLIVSELVPIKTFGLTSGLGVLLTWLYTYCFLVPGLLLMPSTGRLEKEIKSTWPLRYMTFITKNKRIIMIAFLFVTSVLLYNIKNLHIDMNPYKNFKAEHPLNRSNQAIIKSFGGVSGPEIVIDSGKIDGIKSYEFLARVDQFIAELLLDEKINHISSGLDVIKKMNETITGIQEVPKTSQAISQLIFMYDISVESEKSLRNYFSLDYRKLRLGLSWSYQSAVAGLKKSQWITMKAKEYGLDAYVTGKVHGKQKMVTMVVATFLKSISVSFFIVMVLMMWHLRSIGLGLLAMIPNITPLAFASGLLGMTSHPVDITVAVVSSVCLGIAVDDTIHFLNEYTKKRRLGFSIQESLLLIFTNISQSLILTTIILVVGFGIFAFSDFIPNRNFGVLSSGVLLVALITDLVFLPVVLIYVDKYFKKSESFH